MTRARARAALVLVLVGAAAAADARADALPYDEDTERPLRSSVVIRGVDRFPEHAIVLYPSACTNELVDLEQYDEDDALLARATEPRGPIDFRRVAEGQPLGWRRGENYCADTGLYALPLALYAELAGLSTRDRRDLFESDPRIVRASDYRLPETTPAVAKRSPLRAVAEAIEVRAVDAAGLEIVIEAITLTFRDKTSQRLAVSSSERPDYPSKPLSAEALATAEIWAAERAAAIAEQGAARAAAAAGANPDPDADPETSTSTSTAGDAADPGVSTSGAGDGGSAEPAGGSSGGERPATATASAAEPADPQPPPTSAPVTDDEAAPGDDDDDDDDPDPRSRHLMLGLIAGLIAALALWGALRQGQGR